MGRVGFQMSISAVIAIVISVIFVAVLVSSFGGQGQQDFSPNSSETTRENEDPLNQQSTGYNANRSQDSGSSSDDVVHTGEEAVEEYISTVGDSSDLPEGVNGYPPVGSSEYQWVEFEDPMNQINKSEDFENNPPFLNENVRGLWRSTDIIYLALSESSDGYDTTWVGIDTNNWGNKPVVVNSGKIESYPVGVSSESIEAFFSNNLGGYNDTSDNFPTGLLTSIKE